MEMLRQERKRLAHHHVDLATPRDNGVLVKKMPLHV